MSLLNLAVEKLMMIAKAINIDSYNNMSRQQLQNKFATFPASILAPVPNPIPRPRPRPVSETHPNPYLQIDFFSYPIPRPRSTSEKYR